MESRDTAKAWKTRGRDDPMHHYLWDDSYGRPRRVAFAVTSHRLGQKPLDFRAVLPQQSLQVEHARPRLLTIERG